MSDERTPAGKSVSRRDFVRTSALTAAALVAGVDSAEASKVSTPKPLSYNENMEYRRLGRTGVMVSAVCLGGHWKRVNTMLKTPFDQEAYSGEEYMLPEFMKNRSDVITRCLEVGINYVDACNGAEIMVYSKALRGRRDKMYLGYSWHLRESRYPEWRSAKKLLEGLDLGLREAQLDYIDLWRISLPQQQVGDVDELEVTEHGAVEALEKAKKQGKVRFTGISTHNRVWLKSMIQDYPQQMEVVLFPYTASTKTLPYDSLFETVKKYDVGVLGIKPFADNSLFQGDSSPSSPTAEEDSRRARLAIRYILSNPAISAPMPGLASTAQVDNVAKAVMERKKLGDKELADLGKATDQMWAKLPGHYEWLRDWQHV
jgi:aryl-alcohol dehydrogenase-like predicted oxidoreductase